MAIVRHLVELLAVPQASRAKAKGRARHSGFACRCTRDAMPNLPADALRNAPAELRDTELEQLDGVRILIVEDDTDSRNVLSMLLERLGAFVEAVSSAREAFDCVTNRRPDVLVSDIGMPDEDGYSLIRRVREMGHKRKLPAGE